MSSNQSQLKWVASITIDAEEDVGGGRLKGEKESDRARHMSRRQTGF